MRILEEYDIYKDIVPINRGRLDPHKGTHNNTNSLRIILKNRLLTLTPEDNRGKQSHDKPNGVFFVFLVRRLRSIKTQLIRKRGQATFCINKWQHKYMKVYINVDLT